MSERSADQHPSNLNWIRREDQGGVIQFDGLQVHVGLVDAFENESSSADRFLAVKIPPMVDRVATLAEDLEPKHIVELGIYKGGSVVLYNELFRPRKLVALDVSSERLPSLDHYAQTRPDPSSVSLHYGVNQADRARLAQIYAAEFQDQPLDLVIDDASHFLSETRESFRELFPRLRPNGVYMIEDWAWAHWPGDLWQRDEGGDNYFRGKEAVTNLILETIVLSASKPEWVARVAVDTSMVWVTRGPGQIEPGFDPSEYCLNRGSPLPRFTVQTPPHQRRRVWPPSRRWLSPRRWYARLTR